MLTDLRLRLSAKVSSSRMRSASLAQPLRTKCSRLERSERPSSMVVKWLRPMVRARRSLSPEMAVEGKLWRSLALRSRSRRALRSLKRSAGRVTRPQ